MLNDLLEDASSHWEGVRGREGKTTRQIYLHNFDLSNSMVNFHDNIPDLGFVNGETLVIEIGLHIFVRRDMNLS